MEGNVGWEVADLDAVGCESTLEGSGCRDGDSFEGEDDDGP